MIVDRDRVDDDEKEEASPMFRTQLINFEAALLSNSGDYLQTLALDRVGSGIIYKRMLRIPLMLCSPRVQLVATDPTFADCTSTPAP